MLGSAPMGELPVAVEPLLEVGRLPVRSEPAITRQVPSRVDAIKQPCCSLPSVCYDTLAWIAGQALLELTLDAVLDSGSVDEQQTIAGLIGAMQICDMWV